MRLEFGETNLVKIGVSALGRCPCATNMHVQSISLSRDMMPTWFHGLRCGDMHITSISADISFGSLNVTFLVQRQAVLVKALFRNKTSYSQHLPSCIYLINEDGPFSWIQILRFANIRILAVDLSAWKLHPLRQQFLIQGHWRSLALPKRLCWMDKRLASIHWARSCLSSTEHSSLCLRFSQ